MLCLFLSSRSLNARSKRPRQDSACLHQLLLDVGSGRANVNQAVSWARTVVSDHGSKSLPDLQSFAELAQAQPTHQERDMHRWIKRLQGAEDFKLEPFYLDLPLVRGSDTCPTPTTTPILLPHEVMSALWDAGEDQFQRSLLGGLGTEARREFWNHCGQQREWSFVNTMSTDQLLPICIHSDGAEMFTNTEHQVWSWSSAFAVLGLESRVEDVKFLMRAIPVSAMPQAASKDVERRIAAVTA